MIIARAETHNNDTQYRTHKTANAKKRGKAAERMINVSDT